MRAFLLRWFGWLAVPSPSPIRPAAPATPDEIPPGLYIFAPGERVTGFEPVSFYLAHRRGDSDHVETIVGAHA